MYTYIYNPVQLASIILSIIGRFYQHCWHSIIGQRLSIIRQCLVWQLHVSNMALDLLNIVHLNNSCIPPFSLLPSSSFLPPPSSSSLSSLFFPFSPFPFLPPHSHSLPFPFSLPLPISPPLSHLLFSIKIRKVNYKNGRDRNRSAQKQRGRNKDEEGAHLRSFFLVTPGRLMQCRLRW